MDPVLILSPEGVIKDLNKETELVFGDSRDDIIGRNVAKYISDRRQAREVLESILATGCASDIRLAVQSSLGRIIAISLNATLYKNDEGKPEAIIAVFRDISGQLRQEVELRQLASVVEDSPDAIFASTVDGVITSWNRGGETMYGYKKEEMIGSSLSRLFLPDQKLLVPQLFERVIKGQSVDHYEVEHLAKDAHRIFVGLRLLPIKDSSANVMGVSIICRDITEQRRLSNDLIAERNSIALANDVLSRQASELARQAAQMERLAEMAGLLQVCETDDEVYFVIAQFAHKLFPESSGTLYVPGNPRSTLERVVDWGSPDPDYEPFPTSDCLASKRAMPHIYNQTHNAEVCGHIKRMEGTYLCAPLVLRGELLGVLSLHWSTKEVVSDEEALTVRVLGDAALALLNLRLRQRLKEMSIRDPLTGLFNRRYMEEFFAQELSRSQRKETNMSIIVFDIDHFKRFNDSFGHEAGDAVLHHLGIFLKKYVRGSDVICRYGGEEIIVLLPETPLDTASRRAERIREDVKALRVQYLEKLLPEVTLSIGVSSFPDHGETVESIFRAADTALYRAKQEGRDRVCIAPPPTTRPPARPSPTRTDPRLPQLTADQPAGNGEISSEEVAALQQAEQEQTEAGAEPEKEETVTT